MTTKKSKLNMEFLKKCTDENTKIFIKKSDIFKKNLVNKNEFNATKDTYYENMPDLESESSDSEDEI